MENSNKNSRRKFLDKGLKVGLITAIGGLGSSKLVNEINAKPESISGKKIELMTTDGTLIQVDTTDVEEIVHSQEHDVKYNVREGYANKKFVMVVDLARCRNAKQCVTACNKHHYITGDNAWLKIYNMKDSEESAPYWMPNLCQHCDKPPCVKVCPVDATFKRRDGIVLIDNERCIGCRFCMAACPYSVRVFNWDEPDQGEIKLDLLMEEHNLEQPTLNYSGIPSIKGTVDKCDFCPHMIDEGELPHCVSACPNGVYFFGDLYEDSVTNGDETFQLSKLLKDNAGYRLMEDLRTMPSVYYLPPKDRQQEFEKGLENYTEFESVEKTEES
jgi:Fe-S-cluster-containing dehydrogenase component